ncbi:MAG: hypothetical protein ACFFG0_04775 [Candidatus Thorarchaeota archaeon]
MSEENNIKTIVREIINGMIEEGLIKIHNPRDVKAFIKKIKDKAIELGGAGKSWTIEKKDALIKYIKDRDIRKLKKATAKLEKLQKQQTE